MRKYLFQRFLPNCNTDDINLEDCTYIGDTYAQRVLISELDEKIDTDDDLRNFLSQYSSEDIIVLASYQTGKIIIPLARYLQIQM